MGLSVPFVTMTVRRCKSMLDLWVTYMVWRAQRRRNWEGDHPDGIPADAGEPQGPSALD